MLVGVYWHGLDSSGLGGVQQLTTEHDNGDVNSIKIRNFLIGLTADSGDSASER
jgi:hypothetical protein